MIDTDKYEGHTENKWEWYEFGDGDWILCPLWEDVTIDEDRGWYVDKEGETIHQHDDIWNWDEMILDLQNNDGYLGGPPTLSSERLPKNNADAALIADAPILFAEVKRLRGLLTQSYDELSLAIRWVERYFESKGHSTAYVAQAVENLERFIEEGEEE